MSKRKMLEVLLAVVAAIAMVTDTVHNKDFEKEIE